MKFTRFLVLGLLVLPTSAAISYADSPNNDNTKLYIVQFSEQPLLTYDGGLPKLETTLFKNNNMKSRGTQNRRYNTKSAVATRYLNHLKTSRAQILSKTYAKHKTLQPLFEYFLTYNGMAIRLSENQAEQLRKTKGIRSVRADYTRYLHTDVGPELIGASNIWQLGPKPLGTKGEGLVVGVIDTGIATDHASFADPAPDGYDHQNPLGKNVYRGDCRENASLCNDKLIGVYSYPAIIDDPRWSLFFPNQPHPTNGEDYNGHGTHVASTIAGNSVFDVPLIDASANPVAGFSLTQISGVAPRANIISYQVCLPGDPGEGDLGNDPLLGCSGAAIVQAIEDAIEDGVDVINFSIGGGPQDPWQDPDSLAFLAARSAGIFVATSAGNSGPDDGSIGSPAVSPWITSVAALSHGRTFSKTLENFQGGTHSPEVVVGRAFPGGVTAPIIHARGISEQRALCDTGFPLGSVAGMIVFCDRGAVPLVDKAINVLKGGAVGLVIGNVVDGPNTLFDISYVLPTIHIDFSAAQNLRTWLSEGKNHSLSITDGQVNLSSEESDIVSDFSSRGPNVAVLDLISPNLGAPGEGIYAAYATTTPYKPNTEGVGQPYKILSGTSMASPHVAGAALLVKALRPLWSAAEIQSALMMTAMTAVRENIPSSANIFATGSGRIQVDTAIEVAFLLDETRENYEAADPRQFGLPATLNLPSLANSRCNNRCRWSRTILGTKSAKFSISFQPITANLIVTVDEAEIATEPGQEISLNFLADTSAVLANEWAFGRIIFTDASGESPDVNFPVAVRRNR